MATISFRAESEMKFWRGFGLVFMILVIFVLLTNLWIVLLGKSRLLSEDPIEVREYAIVLGAGVHGERLSGVLKGRMQKAVDLYRAGLVQKILVSGDGTDAYYNETHAMQKFAIQNNVPSERILADPYGISTYVSIERASRVFEVHSAYVISQEFHVSRAVWLANSLGMDAWGIPTGTVHDEWYYLIREIPARTKDFVFYLFDYTP